MSAPGLYRYFDGREGLLTALIIDALTDLADAVEKARDAVPAGDAGGRFLAVARAYREWALADREGFTLVFGPPLNGVPGRRAGRGPDGPDKAAALRAMDGLRSLTREADEAGTRRPLPLTELPPVLARRSPTAQLHGADPATELAMAAHLGVPARVRHAGGVRQPRAGTGRRSARRCSSAWSGCSPALASGLRLRGTPERTAGRRPSDAAAR